jgi:transposase
MEEVVVGGLDIAKSVFQLHRVSAAGAVVLQRKVTRSRLLPLFGKLAPCSGGKADIRGLGPRQPP